MSCYTCQSDIAQAVSSKAGYPVQIVEVQPNQIGFTQDTRHEDNKREKHAQHKELVPICDYSDLNFNLIPFLCMNFLN